MNISNRSYSPSGKPGSNVVGFGEATDDDAFGGAGMDEFAAFEINADVGGRLGSAGTAGAEEDQVAFAEIVPVYLDAIFAKDIGGRALQRCAIDLFVENGGESGAVYSLFGVAAVAVFYAQPAAACVVQGDVVGRRQTQTKLFRQPDDGLSIVFWRCLDLLARSAGKCTCDGDTNKQYVDYFLHNACKNTS